jgi:hypothetical protein
MIGANKRQFHTFSPFHRIKGGMPSRIIAPQPVHLLTSSRYLEKGLLQNETTLVCFSVIF